MNNFEVIELELLAILAALMMVKENSKVNIYTDNMGVVELWSSLFNENRIIWSTRRIWNINFGASLMIVDLKFLF
jgi:ribonuclease HI